MPSDGEFMSHLLRVVIGLAEDQDVSEDVAVLKRALDAWEEMQTAFASGLKGER